MTKKDIEKDLREFNGGSSFISFYRIGEYLRKSRTDRKKENILRTITTGLSYLPDGRGKKYFVPEVAGRIHELMVKV